MFLECFYEVEQLFSFDWHPFHNAFSSIPFGLIILTFNSGKGAGLKISLYKWEVLFFSCLKLGFK